MPSSQVVTGVTSYGRSFAMAEPGCYTEQCRFTGTVAHSNAKKGPCTDTAGYISNAEIKQILDDPSRVNQHYIDAQSNSNILVYDDTQWVGYMSSDIRASRTAIYQNLNMGGTTNWATDLESFIDPPSRADSWPGFVRTVKNGGDPESRTGHWIDKTCSNPAVSELSNYTPMQRWDMLDAEHAWDDAIYVWKNKYRPKDEFVLSQSIALTLNGPENMKCGSLTDSGQCDEMKVCDDFKGEGTGSKSTGAAAYLIWNSLVEIHSVRISTLLNQRKSAQLTGHRCTAPTTTGWTTRPPLLSIPRSRTLRTSSRQSPRRTI